MSRQVRQKQAARREVEQDPKALQVLNLHQRMYDVRGNFSTLWQTVAERLQPNKADFTMKWAEGQRRTNKVFDDTGPIAVGQGVAAMSSMLIPEGRRWHKIRPLDKRLLRDVKVLQWCDAIEDILFAVRYSPMANFQNQAEECIGDIMSFGTGPFLVDDVVGLGIRYRALSLAMTYGMENAAGIIDTIHWEFEYSAQAVMDAVDKGIFDSAPPEIIERAKAESPPVDKQWTFIHAIYPEDNGRRFSSCIVSKECKYVCKESRYFTQPILMPRYRVNSRETYGRGPGVDCLPTILQLNEMEKADTRITQRAADPPWITADDSALPAFNLRSNSMNPGYMTMDGKPLIQALTGGSNFEVSKEKLDEKRKILRMVFLSDIPQALIDHPEMTATQVLQLAQQRGEVIAPILGRIQSEMLGPMITRELDILHRAGALPPPPEAIKRAGRFEYKIQYAGMNQTIQKQSKAVAIGMVFQQAAPLIQADPTVLKAVNMARTFAELVDANGAPMAMMNTPEEMQAQQEADLQQQQLANMADIAGPASQAIKNLADANKAMGGSPGGIA